MIESRRRAYLDAMGYDLWSVKPPQPELDRLLLQPGKGCTLLICDTPDATAGRIAGDIARALAGEAVWAWPDPEGNHQCPTLEQVVGQRLFSRVVLFGAGLEHQVFRGAAPPVVGSASVTVTVRLDELATLGNAKRAFWERLSGKGLS